MISFRLDPTRFLTRAWRALLQHRGELRRVGRRDALPPAPAREAQWPDDAGLNATARRQIERASDCRAQAVCQLDAAAYALQGLMRDVETTLASSACRRADASLAAPSPARDERFAAAYRRARDLAH